jgi:hypothetical protein
MKLDKIEITKTPEGFRIEGFRDSFAILGFVVISKRIWTENAKDLAEVGEKISLCAKGIHIW